MAWLVFIASDNTVECFDSYGQDPGVYTCSVSGYVCMPRLRVNRHLLQSDFSDVWELYCGYFLRQRLLGTCLETIVQPFIKKKVLSTSACISSSCKE